MPWTSSVAILLLAESSAVTAVKSRCCRRQREERELPQARNCKATSASPSVYFSQYSNRRCLLFQSAISLTCFSSSSSFLRLIFPPSFHFICLSCRLLFFSSCVPVITCLSTFSTNNCLWLFLPVYWFPTKCTTVCLDLYLFQRLSSAQI